MKNAGESGPDMQGKELFHELSYYTLEHPDKSYFIHQHIVDAFTAQNAGADTRPVSIIFALAGLYLFIERNFTGRAVQLIHMKMAERKKEWPAVSLPENRGEITVSDVLKAPPGNERDAMISSWCRSVWKAYRESHETIRGYTQKFLNDVEQV